MEDRLRNEENGRFRKYTCGGYYPEDGCGETFDKDEAHDLYKAYELLERPTVCPRCGREASIN